MTDLPAKPAGPQPVVDVFAELQKHNSALKRGTRGMARLAAVQALYQMDIAQTDIADVLAQFAAYRMPSIEEAAANDGGAAAASEGMLPAAPDMELFHDLVRGVVRLQRQIDPDLNALLATGWRLGRIDSILRAILRSGAYELMARPDVPARVVINDYVDIAHAFFAEDEPKVTNAVLDKLAKRLRPDEFTRSAE